MTYLFIKHCRSQRLEKFTLLTELLGFPSGSGVKKKNKKKYLPAMLDTWGRRQMFDSRQEDLLEEEMAIHSSILAWKIRIHEVAKELDTTG